jgi:hypothetical protein
MKAVVLTSISAVFATGVALQAFAHGDQPHPKCKKGYELNDEHKCVKSKQ